MNYFLMPKGVFNNIEVGTYEIVTLAVLCKFANGNNECFPSRKTISEYGGFSIATYNKYIVRMLLHGLVKKESRWRRNMSQTSNLFTISRKKRDCFKVRSDIFQQGLSTKALCVYLCLCRYKAEDDCCRVSQRIIARDCSLSLASVICAVAELRKAGFLDTQRQTNISNNGNYVLLYMLSSDRRNKNVIHKRVDTDNIRLKFNDTIRLNAYVIGRRLNRLLLDNPMQITYSPCVKYTPPKLYIF